MKRKGEKGKQTIKRKKFKKKNPKKKKKNKKMTSSLENTSFGRHISKKYAKTEGLDFSKILMKKDHLDARTGDETCVSLKPNDFFKILRLLGEKNDDDIESACYSLITCLLENDDDELDPAFFSFLIS